MRVRVLFFGQLKDIVGLGQEETDMSEGSRVEDLFQLYRQRFPKLAEFRPSIAASLNQEYTDWRAALTGGDEVAFLPPVSGGEDIAASDDLIQIVRHEIGSRGLMESLKAPGDGALVFFEGFVRDNFKGQKTQYLEYEAYEPMAYAKMREIAQQMREKFAIDRLAMVHRLGRLEVGETSVLVAVSAAHRGAAFDACRYGIDTLKRVVPIWKKEYFVGGAVWAEGEKTAEKPFSPDEESTS